VSQGIERIWAKDGVAAWALTPLSWMFGAVTGVRNLLYDVGLMRAHPLGLPTVSVGNLTVGGTGKTPVAAWVAAELAALGARPAVLLRGYGADEPLVHQHLNPAVMVIPNPDRVAGAALARARGASVLVLDDAFQHRRAARDVDIVLVAAEQRAAHRLLPAGPLREGRRALRRASVLVVTRKSASPAEAESAAATWTGFAGAPPSVVVALAPDALMPVGGVRQSVAAASGAEPLTALHGRRVLAISAIGAPSAFEAQLAAAGAQVTPARYPDHHAFDADDVASLARRGADVDRVVCTLKDAVKLGPRWPAQASPLWYLSQAVVVERGASVLREAMHRLVGPPQP
jgi:tetraacyldisaccharide 4'-kinase